MYTFAQIFHLKVWFSKFINEITFKCDYVLWLIIAMLEWIDIWTKLKIYKVPPDPVIWYCRGFVSLPKS